MPQTLGFSHRMQPGHGAGRAAPGSPHHPAPAHGLLAAGGCSRDEGGVGPSDQLRSSTRREASRAWIEASAAQPPSHPKSANRLLPRPASSCHSHSTAAALPGLQRHRALSSGQQPVPTRRGASRRGAGPAGPAGGGAFHPGGGGPVCGAWPAARPVYGWELFGSLVGGGLWRCVVQAQGQHSVPPMHAWSQPGLLSIAPA